MCAQEARFRAYVSQWQESERWGQEVRKCWMMSLGCPTYVNGVLYTQHFADRSPLWQGKCFKRSAELLMETTPHNWHIFPTKMSIAEDIQGGSVWEKSLFRSLVCFMFLRTKGKRFLHRYKWSEQIYRLTRAKLLKVLASLPRHRKRLRSAPVVSGCQAGGVEESAFYLLLQTKVNYVN